MVFVLSLFYFYLFFIRGDQMTKEFSDSTSFVHLLIWKEEQEYGKQRNLFSQRI